MKIEKPKERWKWRRILMRLMRISYEILLFQHLYSGTINLRKNPFKNQTI
jgi:hypothetical protein